MFQKRKKKKNEELNLVHLTISACTIIHALVSVCVCVCVKHVCILSLVSF